MADRLMRPLQAALLVSGLIAAAAALVAAPTAEANTEFVVKGQALAAERCARCHATGERDPSPHAKAPPFRDVVTRYPSEHLAEALAEGIVSGHPDMPVYVFSGEEIEAFLAYLDSLGSPRQPKAATGGKPAQPKP